MSLNIYCMWFKKQILSKLDQEIVYFKLILSKNMNSRIWGFSPTRP